MQIALTEELVRLALYAHRRDTPGPLSTGESLAVALILNRADWLKDMNYTIVEALARIGAEWSAALPDAEQTVRDYIAQHEGEQ